MKVQVSYEADWNLFLRIILLSLALVPLVVFPWTLFPSVFGKVTVIRFAVALFWVVFSASLFLRRGETADAGKPEWSFVRHPVFIAVIVFVGILLLSSIFAVVPERAFFGNVERGEGFLHILFVLFFLIAALMVFRERDWLSFFKLSVIAGDIIAIDAFREYLNTGQRAHGFTIDNPTFVAAYLLFVIFAALVLITRSSKKGFWYFLSYASIAAGLAGLLATNTRGAFAGLFVGAAASAVYLVFRGSRRGPRFFFRRLSWRVVGAGVLSFMVAFTILFLATKDSGVWRKVPPFDRLSEISLQDNTVRSRLISAGISMDAVNPSKNGALRFLLGWGSDNFSIAFNANYRPEFQNYDIKWFDRAHNKIFDVLVMQGALGLVSYLALWWLVVKYAFAAGAGEARRGEEGRSADAERQALIGGPLLFFAVAYFVQNLFVFDQATTYIPLFALFGYTIHTSLKRGGTANGTPLPGGGGRVVRYGSVLVAALFSVLFLLYSVIPFNQMRIMQKYLVAGDLLGLYNNLDSITKPFNYAQYEIRFYLLRTAARLVKEPAARPFVEQTAKLLEEATLKDGYDPRYYQALGLINGLMAKYYGNDELYGKAEEYLRKSVELAPKRQDNTFLLAQALISQGKFSEVKAVIDESLSYAPGTPHGRFQHAITLAPYNWNDGKDYVEELKDVFRTNYPLLADRFLLDEGQAAFVRNSYNEYLNYFLRTRDEEGFLLVMNNALRIEKALDEIWAEQVASGLMDKPGTSLVGHIEAGIRAFRANGWAAIEGPQQVQEDQGQ